MFVAGDVEHEVGVVYFAEVHCVVEEEPFGISWWALLCPGFVYFGEFGGEAGVDDGAGYGEVVGVGVFEVGGEEDLGLVFADGAGDGVSELEVGLYEAVGEAEEMSFYAERLGCVCGFDGTGFGVAERGWFAVGDVEEDYVMTLVGEFGDGSAHADFLIVGMWSYDEDVCHFWGAPVERADSTCGRRW